MTNPARVRRFARQYREHLANWRPRPFTEAEWLVQKARAEARMVGQDRLIAQGCGWVGRISDGMMEAGPLLTDERPASLMRRMAAGVMTAEDFE